MNGFWSSVPTANLSYCCPHGEGHSYMAVTIESGWDFGRKQWQSLHREHIPSDSNIPSTANMDGPI